MTNLHNVMQGVGALAYAHASPLPALAGDIIDIHNIYHDKTRTSDSLETCGWPSTARGSRSIREELWRQSRHTHTKSKT